MESIKTKTRRTAPVVTDQRVVVLEQLPSLGVYYSRVHLDRLEKAGRFPRHVQIGPGRIGWLQHEVEAWVAGFIGRRDAKPAPAPTPIIRRRLTGASP
jgi:prophage regulatory protein